MNDKAPSIERLQARVPAVAAGSDANSPIGEAPFAGTITEASYTPDAAITGANTDTRTISLVNRGSDGTGTTVIATLALTSGVNAASGDEKQLTLSAVSGTTTVAADDVLAFKSTHSGSTGLADPGGLVQASVTRS